MICVGIDVSKRKSTVCFMAPGDKIIRRPFDVKHLSLIHISEPTRPY